MKTSYLLRFWLITMLATGAFLPQSVAQKALPARENGLQMAAAGTSEKPMNTVVTVVTGSSSSSSIAPRTAGSALQPEQAKAIEEIATYLPTQCKGIIRNLYVRYDHPEQRGLGGKTTVIISGNLPLTEFRAVLVHEVLGHAMDLGCLTGTQSSGPTPYKDGGDQMYRDDPSINFYRLSWATSKTRLPESQDGDFVSSYARTDAFEDLAETVTFYMFQREEFRRIAKHNALLAAKLRWIETVAYPSAQNYALGTYQWNSTDIPWDTTMLQYVWLGPAVASVQD